MGAPLATPPFRTDHGDGCVYRDGNFHSVVVEPIWDSGATAFRMYGAMQSQVGPNDVVELVDGAGIAGEWDEARVVGCCTFMALRGDRAVSVDVTGPTTLTPIQTSDYAARHRPGRVTACTLRTRPEAEALIGPLTGDPKPRGDACIYPRPSSTGTYSEEAELSVDWEGGLRRLRDSTAVGIRFDTTANPAWEASGASVGPGFKPEQILAVLAKAVSRIS